MSRPDFPYRKLPGVRHGIVSGASLWLGHDHILHVKTNRFSEDYRRYYFNDIQAIYLRKAPRFLPPPATVLAVIVGLTTILVFSLFRRMLAVELSWIILAAISGYALWLCIFASCACFIQTALGTDRLSCLHRIRGARAAIDQISAEVLRVQGPQIDYVPQSFPEIPEPIEPGRSREQLFGWLAIPFILISSTLIITLGVPIADRPFKAALATVFPAVISGVLALIAGRGGTRFRALQGAFLALILLCGLELYTLVLVNTYSQPIFLAHANGAAAMSMLASGAHIASTWVAGAAIAAALVTAALLLRNLPIRRNA